MNRARLPYHESLLQWIWKHRHFRPGPLRTARGESLLVHHPGIHNRSDGPDFRMARIGIGKLTWHGDVEIHWTAQDWYAHSHHSNPGFDGVILHVIYDDRRRRRTLRSDGTRIPQLYLRRYLEAPLSRFLEACSRPGLLPCSGLLADLPEEVFRSQIERAQNLYFHRKIADTRRWYPDGLPPERAWIRMTGKALFDGLGIAYNREPMRGLFDRMTATGEVDASGLRWNHRGCRPNNHPRLRIRQAVACYRHLAGRPLDHFRDSDPAEIWEAMLRDIPAADRPGTERASILYGTVLLPSLWLLGELLDHPQLQPRAQAEWDRHRPLIPDDLLEPFFLTPVSPELYRRRPGAVYQLRHFCRRRRCEDCEVFQSAIYP